MKMGAKSMEIRNRTAVVKAVRPVLPPAATPAEDSTKVVVVEVPNTAPAEVATASASSAGLMAGSLPSLSSMFALVLTPMSVPSVSNRSTNRKEKVTTTKFRMPTLPKSSLKH